MKTIIIMLFIFSYALIAQANIINVPDTKPTLAEAIEISNLPVEPVFEMTSWFDESD